MKKIITIPVLILFATLIISSCGNKKIISDEKYLESLTIYMIPYKYGQASESDKYKWEFVSFNPDSTIKRKEHITDFGFSSGDLYYLEFENNVYENGLLKEKIEGEVIDTSFIKLFQRKAYCLLMEKWEIEGEIGDTIYHGRTVYNYSNNLLSNVNVYYESGLAEKSTYEYSGNNKVSRMLHYDWFNDFENSYTHVYSYDTNGNMIRDSVAHPNYPYFIFIWEYDSFNNMIKKSFYSSEKGNTTVREIRKYTYDNEGRIIQYIFSDHDDFQKHLYQYLDNGLISKVDIYESKNGIEGNFEQKGILKYEYNYKDYP
ncbi:hypothetical protein ES705_36718 [subsurface metagenome]